MRINLPGQDITLDSAADLSTHQYKFAIGAAASGNSQLARANVSGANGQPVGIIQNKPAAANLGVVVRISGRSKLVVDGTVGGGTAVGTGLKSDASGRGVTAVTDKDKVGAIALEVSTAANDIIDVMVVNFHASI